MIRLLPLLLACLLTTAPALAQEKPDHDPRPLQRTQHTPRPQLAGQSALQDLLRSRADRPLSLNATSTKQGPAATPSSRSLRARTSALGAAPAAKEANFRVRRAENGTVRWMEGLLWEASLGKQAALEAYAGAAQTALAAYAGALRLDDPARELRTSEVTTDELGFIHVRFDQVYDGVPVWGRDLVAHFDGSGQLYIVNGAYEPTPRDLETMPSISADVAWQQAIERLQRENRWAPVDEALAQTLGLQGAAPRLVIYPDAEQGMRLAYEVSIHPNLAEWYSYFVDAQSGEVLHRIARHCMLFPEAHAHDVLPNPDVRLADSGASAVSSDVRAAPLRRGTFTNASASDLNGQVQNIRVHQDDDGTYLLFSDLDNIGAFNLQAGLPDNGGAVTLTANNTDLGPNANVSYVLSNDNTWSDPVSVSAHANMTVTYNYFKNTFGRRAINDENQSIFSIVHITENGQPVDNAFWNGRSVIYGDGRNAFSPLAGALDVAAHEFSHGVIQHTAGLVYELQSGALNESFSDVFGVLVEREDFLLGEDVVLGGRSALRNLLQPDDPSVLSPQPAHMRDFRVLPNTEEGDNGGVHVNSGIPNRAAALVIDALGLDRAGAIYYRALSTYLTRSSQFGDARQSLVQAATDLYGATSAEASTVAQAFDAVGVGAGQDMSDPNENDVPPMTDGLSLITFVIPDGSALSLPNGAIAWVDPATGTAEVFSDPGAVARVGTDERSGSQLSMPADGQSIWFINPDQKLAFIDLAGRDASNLSGAPVNVFENLQIEQEGDLWNAAIAPDESSVALTSAYENDATLYFSQDGQTTTALPLKPETTQQGIESETVVYPDFLVWAPFRTTGSDPNTLKIAFDALNEQSLEGIDFTYWSIYEISFDLQNNSVGIYSLIPAQPTSVHIGSIDYSNADPDVVTYSHVEGTTHDIILADFERSIKIPLGLPTAPGTAPQDAEAPTFSPDDATLVFSSPSNRALVFYERATGRLSQLSFADFNIAPTLPYWFTFSTTATANEEEETLPTASRLRSSFPNPFTTSTTLQFDVAEPGRVTLQVFDVLGREVARLLDEPMAPGTHEAIFEAGTLAPGTYLTRLQAGGTVQTRTVTLLR